MDTREEKEVFVIKQFVGCPKNCAGCQFNCIKSMPSIKFINWINKIPEEEIDQYIVNCKHCKENNSIDESEFLFEDFF